MVKVAELEEVFPQSSVAVHTTVVEPRGKADGALLETDTKDVQLSVAVAVPIEPTKVFRTFVLTSINAGQLITGGVVSSIVIAWEQDVLFPDASVMVQVLVTVIGQEPMAASI
jgi:hypothetical protein